MSLSDRSLFDSNGQAKPIHSFIQSHFGNVHLNEIDDVVHGVTHAVAPVVHAAAPVVHALGKGVRHEVIRAGYPFSLASGDFVHELIVWFRRAVWFMLYTGAVTLSPQILVLTLALGCVFEWVLRFGNIEKGYLSAPHHEHYESHGYDGGHGHHGGGNGYHGKFDVDVDEDVDYEYADYGNVDYAAYAAAAAGEPGASYAGDYSDLFSPEAKSDSAATVAPNLSPNPQVITTAAAAEAPQRHSRKQPYSFVTPSVYEVFDEHFKPADDDFEFEASDPIVGNFDYEALRL